MNKKITWFVIVLAVIIVMFVGISNRPSANLTFGLISGMSGDYAAVGDAFAKGAELAQEEWNIANPDRQIDIVKEDDGFNAKKGLSAYKKLTSIDHIDGLINMTTVTIDALYADVVASGMPVALGFEQGIEAKNDNVVQLWPGTVPAEEKLGAHVREKGFKNIVVLVDKESAVFERFANGFIKGYGLAVQEIKTGSDSGDIKSNALKILTIEPDAVVFIVTPTTGALLVKELNLLSKARYQFVFDANIQTGFTDYSKILGDTNVLNGSILYAIPNIYRQEFSESYKKKFGQEPTIGSETGYNAFILLSSAYNVDKKVWAENMQKASFVGADGKIIFDENGIRIPELEIGVIKNGRLPD